MPGLAPALYVRGSSASQNSLHALPCPHSSSGNPAPSKHRTPLFCLLPFYLPPSKQTLNSSHACVGALTRGTNRHTRHSCHSAQLTFPKAPLAVMFVLAVLSDSIRVPPHDFDKADEGVLRHEINIKYSNKVQRSPRVQRTT